MTVAYLINQYPKVSHTFIRREILALEAQGVPVLRFALRGWDDSPVDQEDLGEQRKTLYVLKQGLLGLLRAMFIVLMLNPGLVRRGLQDCWALSRGGDRSFWVMVVYFAEACWLLRALRSIERLSGGEGVKHLHAHFGTNPAAVAYLLRGIGGPTYSFTVHGPEEFDRPQALKLNLKAHRAKAVVAISSFGRSQLFRWLSPVDWSKVQVVKCGLDEKSFSSKDASAERSGVASRRLVCVGRFNEQKGHLLLLSAARLLQERGHAFELVLAGDGELRPVIERFLLENEMAHCVQITGWIDSERVRQELNRSRALVLPSFAEGLPVVVMEALALGVPVITTFVAGIPELVEDGRNGWLVPAGDTERLAAAMALALDLPDETVIRMGALGLNRVREEHAIVQSARRLREQVFASPK